MTPPPRHFLYYNIYLNYFIIKTLYNLDKAYRWKGLRLEVLSLATVRSDIETEMYYFVAGERVKKLLWNVGVTRWLFLVLHLNKIERNLDFFYINLKLA